MKLHKLLIYTLLACVVACEEDMFNIDFATSEATPIMTSLISAGEPVSVWVYNSVLYADTAKWRPISESCIVNLKVDDAEYTQVIAPSDSCTTFGVPTEAGDKIEISVSITEKTLSAQTQILEPVKIQAIDTLTIGATKMFTLHMTDTDTATNYYQIEVFKRYWTAGAHIDKKITCDYTHYIFKLIPSLWTRSTQSNGLFQDIESTEKYRKYSINFQTNISQLNDSVSQAEIDSTTVAIRLWHHTSDYFHYLSAISAQSGYAFLPTVSTVESTSNVVGDGYGMVSGLSYDEMELTLSRQNEPNTLNPQKVSLF